MLIDWFTVIAQIVNFLILVWLLKRFLYQPILRALDAREKRIAAELAAADAKKREAEKERDEFRQKNDEFEQQRLVLLGRASAEAHAERQRLITAARTDAGELRAQWEEALKREYEDLRAALSRRIGAEVFAITRKVLADLADTTLEAHMADAFIERLRALSPEEKANLVSITRLSAAASPATPATPATPAAAETAGILIRSAFDLPATQQNAIKAAIKEILDTRIPVRFETRPDLISGIELIANGHKVTWNIAGYLASLEEEIGKLLKSPGEPEPEAGLEPEPELEAEPETETSVKEKNRDKKKLNTPDIPNLKSSEHIR
ncbi:F0F1 ATP synthase subunit B [Nitrosospira sp. Nsp1]|uniref:F0F1 ATP synthase subunit B family protein n=1 Tax=Nitrosospira sp. Nsp1 TaxID=136547 RepID=UPI0008873529|nr:F0F1 ATP synthase subunit B [Nitrosospira sp. Nsp1]SCX60788.1 ATP synthase F0 subcomplex B subunit [Nitrosospira sp. Nsp1]